MSSYINHLKDWSRRLCVDNYFWPHDYGYLKLEEKDNWMNISITWKKLITEEMFVKIKKSL